MERAGIPSKCRYAVLCLSKFPACFQQLTPCRLTPTSKAIPCSKDASYFSSLLQVKCSSCGKSLSLNLLNLMLSHSLAFFLFVTVFISKTQKVKKCYCIDSVSICFHMKRTPLDVRTEIERQ